MSNIYSPWSADSLRCHARFSVDWTARVWTRASQIQDGRKQCEESYVRSIYENKYEQRLIKILIVS